MEWIALASLGLMAGVSATGMVILYVIYRGSHEQTCRTLAQADESRAESARQLDKAINKLFAALKPGEYQGYRRVSGTREVEHHKVPSHADNNDERAAHLDAAKAKMQELRDMLASHYSEGGAPGDRMVTTAADYEGAEPP